MKKLFVIAIVITTLFGCSSEVPPLTEHNGKNFCMKVTTGVGDIDLLLNAEKAPISAQNFLNYANADHYSGTIFHRVIKNFMIQGGGHTADLSEKESGKPIVNEAGNGLSNVRGSLAMARTMELDSARSQFYINHKDNLRLDDLKYAVFGKVVSGMEIVDVIAGVETGNQNRTQNVPVEPVIIQTVKHIRCPAAE